MSGQVAPAPKIEDGDDLPQTPVTDFHLDPASCTGTIHAQDAIVRKDALLHEAALQKLQDALAQKAKDKDDKGVIFRVTFHNLGSTDVIAQSFFADVNVHLEWYEPDLALLESTQPVGHFRHRPGAAAPEEALSVITVPELFFENALEFEALNEPILTLRTIDPPGIVRWEQRSRGTFCELFELPDFPYDMQLLSVSMRMNSIHDYTTKRYGQQLFEPEIKPWIKLAEWHIHEPRGVGGYDDKGKGHFAAHAVVVRRHKYYTVNLMVLMAAICSVGFMGYAIPPEEFNDRSALVLTILLTAVAFKFAVSDQLPKVPYMTVLDLFYLCNLALLLAIMIAMTLATTLELDNAGDFDYWAGAGLGVVWFLFLIAFYVYVRVWKIGPLKELLGKEVNVEQEKECNLDRYAKIKEACATYHH